MQFISGKLCKIVQVQGVHEEDDETDVCNDVVVNAVDDNDDDMLSILEMRDAGVSSSCKT